MRKLYIAQEILFTFWKRNKTNIMEREEQNIRRAKFLDAEYTRSLIVGMLKGDNVGIFIERDTGGN